MTVFPPFLANDAIEAAWPMNIDRPEEGQFEIGLALGGTVSAGSYTAGVLDFLLEALDAWQEAKDDDKNPSHGAAPRHNVAVRVIAGASGGAVNGILFARMAEYKSPRGPISDNPLYGAWTQVLIDDLLDTKTQDGFRSLLNASAIAQVADRYIKVAGLPGPRRPFLSNPLRVFATVTNVTGLPYRIEMSGETRLAHSMSNMADWAHLLAPISTGSIDNLRKFVNQDSVTLDRDQPDGWKAALDACLATSAFPGAFPPQQIVRDALSPCYRFYYTSDDSGKPEVCQVAPDWAMLAPKYPAESHVKSLNVDGGACNNEPIDIARRVLAGYGGRNPRHRRDACRATVLIDPFSDGAGLGPIDPPNEPFSPLVRLLGGLISQARFKPEDLALAQDNEVFSRFMIAPIGQGKTAIIPGKTVATVGDMAIAAGAFSGFSGFLKRDFLDYDFKLGRHNAYLFLTKHFFLDADNNLFKGERWPDKAVGVPQWEQVEKDKNNADVRYRAIIPVMPTVAVPEDPGILPQITLAELDGIYADVDRRLQWIFDRTKDLLLKESGWLGGALARGYLNLGWWRAKRLLSDFIQSGAEEELTERGLMRKRPKADAAQSGRRGSDK
jgi:hypothetical protein